jgi:hypothetical protein
MVRESPGRGPTDLGRRSVNVSCRSRLSQGFRKFDVQTAMEPCYFRIGLVVDHQDSESKRTQVPHQSTRFHNFAAVQY